MRSRVPLPVRVLKIVVTTAAIVIVAHWLTAGSNGRNPNLDAPSYSERLAAQHDCWTSGRTDLPTAAVLTMREDVAARYTTNPAEVKLALDHVLGDRTDKRVYSVTALCLD